MKKQLLILAALLIPFTVIANDRPTTRLAEGDSCEVVPTNEDIPTPPSPLPSPTPTNTPPIPSPTPTNIPPGPQPLPTEPCEFYKVEKKYAGDYNILEDPYDWDVDFNSHFAVLSFDDVVKQDEESKKLSCLNDMISNASKTCTRDFYTNMITNHELRTMQDLYGLYVTYLGLADPNIVSKPENLDFRYDDCMAAMLTKDYMRTHEDAKKYNQVGIGYCEGNTRSGNYTVAHLMGYNGHEIYKHRINNLCDAGYFYMDSNCKGVPYKDVEGKKICGTTLISHAPTASPLSLIWEHDYNINSNVTFANFKLNPNEVNPWTSWKASDKAPLLVYDPDNTNFVKDATQLFGNWTFGGKRSASLSSNKAISAWGNGYEALGSLDSDSNGKIDGDELRDLALWFDSNRNGISEKGEVKRVTTLGIKALYYKGAIKDSTSEDLRLELGYERELAGRTVQGASIDWYGATAPSKAALADYYSFVRKDAGSDITREAEALSANTTNGKFTGTWQWFLDDKSNVPNGYLIFAEDADSNKVTGYSFVERRFSRSPNNFLKSMINFFRLEGQTTDSDSMSFELTDKNRKTRSEVTLSKDGKVLRGTSYVTVARGAEIASYTWIAKKI